jgi:hypothetical protein
MCALYHMDGTRYIGPRLVNKMQLFYQGASQIPATEL